MRIPRPDISCLILSLYIDLYTSIYAYFMFISYHFYICDMISDLSLGSTCLIKIYIYLFNFS